MATANKTQATTASVKAFLDAIEDEGKRRDARTIDTLMRKATGEKPVMWGASIVGYGRTHYEYESGHAGECAMVGFSPRKAALTLYVLAGFAGQEALLEKLGKHTTGKSCLYIKKLADIDLDVLRDLLAASVRHMRERSAPAR
jgi:hypothetical protein